MARLPEVFLEWNYYARRALLQEIVDGKRMSPERLLLDSTRHNPTLITAACVNGEVVLDARIVGISYVLREEYVAEAIRRLEEHLKMTDEEYLRASGDRDRLRRLYEEHRMRGVKLLLELVFHPRGVAEKYIDFEKLAIIEEPANRFRDRSMQTRSIVQAGSTASLIFFQPPGTSFEVKGKLTIHTDDTIHRLVTLIQDAYHYTPPEERGERPVYLLHVEQVYDKSFTPAGYERRTV